MKKAIRVCSLLCMALLLVGIMSCGNVSGAKGSEADTWTKVTSLEQLKGTWEGTMTVTEGTLPAEMTMRMEYPVTENGQKGLKSSMIFDMTGAIDEMAKESGLSADALWQEMKNEMQEEGVEFSDGRPYTMARASLTPEDEVLLSLTEDDVAFINQSKTKLKMDYGDGDVLILNKK